MVLLRICTLPLQESRELSALCHSLLAGIATEGDPGPSPSPSPLLFSSSKPVTTVSNAVQGFLLLGATSASQLMITNLFYVWKCCREGLQERF